MAHDHRMNPLASNHRPTPRLAQLIAKRQRGFKSSPDIAQGMLNEYRDRRDAGDEDRVSFITGKNETALSLANDRQFINDSLKTRHWNW